MFFYFIIRSNQIQSIYPIKALCSLSGLEILTLGFKFYIFILFLSFFYLKFKPNPILRADQGSG